MRYALIVLALVAGTVAAAAFDGPVPWRKYPQLRAASTRLEIVGDGGNVIPAGKAYDWLNGHAIMNDCMVSDGGSRNVLITCTRRGLYRDTPKKTIKLIFTYIGTFTNPNTLRIVSGTTKGNPLVGEDLKEHFRDEIEE